MEADLSNQGWGEGFCRGQQVHFLQETDTFLESKLLVKVFVRSVSGVRISSLGNASRGHRNYNESLFSDPIRKAEWLKKTLQNKKMNSHEFIISLLIREARWEERAFEFTGNGRKIIDGYCPDFVSEKLKWISEYQGRSGARDARPIIHREKRLQTFRDNGYNILVLNTKEDFSRQEQTIQKIRSFIGQSVSIVARTDPEFLFVPVQSVSVSKKANSRFRINVFNLEVEEDNSYICQGIAMHNCEAFAESYTQLSDIKMWAFRFGTVLGDRCRRGAIWDFVGKLQANPNELESRGWQAEERLSFRLGLCRGNNDRISEGKAIFKHIQHRMQELTSVNRVADIVVKEMHLPNVTKKYTGGSRGWIGDNPVVHLDVSKLKSCGWKPKFTAEETLTSTTRWTIAERS